MPGAFHPLLAVQPPQQKRYPVTAAVSYIILRISHIFTRNTKQASTQKKKKRPVLQKEEDTSMRIFTDTLFDIVAPKFREQNVLQCCARQKKVVAKQQEVKHKQKATTHHTAHTTKSAPC